MSTLELSSSPLTPAPEVPKRGSSLPKSITAKDALEVETMSLPILVMQESEGLTFLGDLPDCPRKQGDNLSIASIDSYESDLDPLAAPSPSPSPPLLSRNTSSSTARPSSRDSATPASAPTYATMPLPPTPPGATPTLSNIRDWAPSNRLPTFTPQLSHLPAPPATLNAMWAGPTSFPNRIETRLETELQYSVLRLISPTSFESLLNDPVGRANFGTYLKSTKEGSKDLELWWDLQVLQKLSDQARVAALGIRDVYLVPGAQDEVQLAPETLKSAVVALRGVMGAGGLLGPSQILLDRLYANEFETYVKHRLVEEAKVRLGDLNLTEQERAGLGDAFCLTNPRLNDCPIVLCSAAFCAITGYSAAQIVGRNCRFLQGRATAPSSVRAIRTALDAEQPLTQLLLNYTAEGVPFWNLLAIIPLFDTFGKMTYFIGGQTNVTGLMAAGKNLSFLLGDIHQVDQKPSVDKFSEAVQRRSKEHQEHTVSDFEHPLLKQSSPLIASRAPSITTSEPSVASTKPASKRFSRFFLPKATRGTASKRPVLQTIAGAESSAIQGLTPAPLHAQVASFTSAYEKVLLFRRAGRQVLFVSPAFLKHCGLPTSTSSELYSSPLLHQDFLDVVTGAGRVETKALRKEIKLAIRDAKPLSITCGIRVHQGGFFSRKDTVPLVQGTLRLTPLMETVSESVAFVAMFG